MSACPLCGQSIPDKAQPFVSLNDTVLSWLRISSKNKKPRSQATWKSIAPFIFPTSIRAVIRAMTDRVTRAALLASKSLLQRLPSHFVLDQARHGLTFCEAVSQAWFGDISQEKAIRLIVAYAVFKVRGTVEANRVLAGKTVTLTHINDTVKHSTIAVIIVKRDNTISHKLCGRLVDCAPSNRDFVTLWQVAHDAYIPVSE